MQFKQSHAAYLPLIGAMVQEYRRGGDFNIGLEEIARAAGISLTGFYQRWYSANYSRETSRMPDHFSRENIGELITLLEKVHPGPAEEAFTAAGLFFPRETRTRAMEQFLETAARN